MRSSLKISGPGTMPGLPFQPSTRVLCMPALGVRAGGVVKQEGARFPRTLAKPRRVTPTQLLNDAPGQLTSYCWGPPHHGDLRFTVHKPEGWRASDLLCELVEDLRRWRFRAALQGVGNLRNLPRESLEIDKIL